MTQISEKINEIAILVMMLGAEDVQGMDLVVKICQDLRPETTKDASLTRLNSALQFIIDERQKISTAQYYELMNKFITAAQNDAQGQACVYPGESQSEATERPVTVVDDSLLAEYVETHLLMLEDFEANILEFQINQDTKSGDEFTSDVKRYLHNLKGDSGSVGISSIESVCHKIEEILIARPARDLLTPLMKFKEWALKALRALTSKEALPSADEIMGEFTAVSEASSVNTPFDTPIFRDGSASESSLSKYTLTGEKDIFAEFLAEGEEHLNNVESTILDSEGNYSQDVIDTIFRGVHSLKGGSAYFTLKEMTETSHILENVLHEVRDGKRTFDEELKALVLVYIDLQKGILQRVKRAVQGNSEMTTAPETSQFLSDIKRYAEGGPPKSTSKPLSASLSSPTSGSPSGASPTQSEAPPKDGSDKAEKLEVKNFVKVDTARLDHLIDSIGEMVVYSSMLIGQCRELLGDREDVIDTTHRVEKFGRDLQDIGMSMRLVPIRGLFQKMSRLVWDASRKLGKQIEFVMEGEETELDRNLIDKLADPLMHMVRNSIDHGVELPDEREAKGKPRTGKVSLSAFHSGGTIHIRIQDDGRGLNPNKLITKAIEKGILSPGASLSNAEAFQLIFAAGFSTAAVVTDISGRGVGMDVVRRNVESLRGRIHIESEIDKGSTFTIELPLTLAIIDGIQIRVGGDQFIIPSLSIVEFIKPTKNLINYTFDRGETLEFRGSFIPVFRLGELYNIEPQFSDPLNATLIVVENHHERVAFMVDEIVGEYQTVIKSLGSMFKDGRGLSGCAIMPSGEVALILDVRSLVTFARQSLTLPTRLESRSEDGSARV